MKEKQLPLLEAQTAWFHVFKSMIDSGDVAKMGPHAVTVYMVIKSYTNWSSGKAWPGVDLIVEKSGVSKRQVLRSLEVLEEYGYITKQKDGRINHYTLREKVQVFDPANPEEDGRPGAIATWDYLPTAVHQAGAELKNFLLTGKKDGMSIIHIDNLTLNLQQIFGNHNKTEQNNFNNADRLSKEIQQLPEGSAVRKAMENHLARMKAK